MISRRGLLKGILAGGIAPAIISIDKMMKIVVPKTILPISFTSKELMMPIDDFAKRIIEPAMRELAKQIDEQFISDFRRLA